MGVGGGLLQTLTNPMTSLKLLSAPFNPQTYQGPSGATPELASDLNRQQGSGPVTGPTYAAGSAGPPPAGSAAFAAANPLGNAFNQTQPQQQKPSYGGVY